MISAKLFTIILCIAVAYFYQKYKTQNDIDNKTGSIINAWKVKLENAEPGFTKLFIGINACTDLIIKGTEVFKALNIKPSAQADHPEINSLVDLQDGFHYHFKRGTAAERPFTHAEEFSRLVKVANTLSNASWYVGGNAALIAHNIAEMFPDVEVNLLGPVGPKLRELLHPSVSVPEESLMDTDEVHLIMEFEVGEKWGTSVAPVATRYITSHDLSNGQAQPLEYFFSAVKQSQADLVVFSGLHMLEGQSEDFWRDKIHSLDMNLQQMPSKTPIHMELASMSDEALMNVVVDKIFSHISALGLNEQELVFLNRVKQGPNWKEMSSLENQPQVSQVTEVLTWILDTYGHEKQLKSKLTRVHFHSLSFHILATVPGYWQDTDVAVAAGTRMGAFKACDSGNLDATMLELKLEEKFRLFPGDPEQELDVNNPVVEFIYKGYKFDFSPVLVCRKPLKTVGLGDAISATGLIYSKYVESR